MYLRYFQTYDKNGVDSEVDLQYWDEEIEEWCNVNLVRVREDRADEFQDVSDRW